ncbi:MAG: hypothetical protein Q9209_006840 [Squamulea sp. 1 TL-2023]
MLLLTTLTLLLTHLPPTSPQTLAAPYLPLLTSRSFDGGPTDFFTRTACYCFGPLPRESGSYTHWWHGDGIGTIRQQEYYNAHLSRLFTVKSSCVSADLYGGSFCVDHRDDDDDSEEHYCLDTPGGGRGNGTNEFCYDASSGTDNSDAEMWGSSYEASFQFNGHVRNLSLETATLFNSSEVMGKCVGLCNPTKLEAQERLVTKNGTVRRPYVQWFTDFADVETCDGCASNCEILEGEEREDCESINNRFVLS